MLTSLGRSAVSPAILKAPGGALKDGTRVLAAIRAMGSVAYTPGICDTLIKMLKKETGKKDLAEIKSIFRTFSEGPAKRRIIRKLQHEQGVRAVREVLSLWDTEGEISALANRLEHMASDGGETAVTADFVETLLQPKFHDLAEQIDSLANKNTYLAQPKNIQDHTRLLQHRNEFVRAGAAWILAATGACRDDTEFRRGASGIVAEQTF